MGFRALEKLINLHDGYRRVFVVDHKSVLLIQEAGKRYLIDAFCPHKDWPFLKAAIEDTVITCPYHGAAFSLKTGENLSACTIPCKPIQSYMLAYEGLFLGVDV